MFTENRIEEQLAKAFDRKVYLPSGGSLVIDRTEAMIVIDVNTGKFIGKGGNLEETVTKNNLEAAEEIARQLRLRDMGGIIVIDFIDMALESNRDQVLRRLVECLGRDRTKHQVAEVTSLGLVQMTRKRVGQGLIEAFSTTCESCGGRGIHIHSEPVRKVALEKDMEQRYVHQFEDEEVDAPEVEVEVEATPVVETPAEPTQVEAPAEPRGSQPRKRRRAVSTGIITPS
jgi:ribonuclease E